VFVRKIGETKSKDSLSLENVAWAGSVLATGKILGLIIQNGKETRMSMNGRPPKNKYGVFDTEVNYVSVYLFIIIIISTLFITIASGAPSTFTVAAQIYMRYFILLSNIIPVNLIFRF
jgi:phospholipid-translocating ATPase